MSIPTPAIVLSVPADPEFVHVLRAVIASVAAQLDLPLEDVDEAKMLVDEASALLLQVGPEASALTLRLEPGDGAFTAVMSSDARVAAWPPPDAKDAWPWAVITGLAEEAGFEATDRGPAIRFVKRRSATEPS